MSKRDVEAQLQKQVRDARKKLDEIEFKRTREATAKLVGRCFRFLNSYSCPKPGERWWLYCCVTGMDEYGHPAATRFQVDKDGKASFEPSRWQVGDDWIEIPRAAFDAAWNEAVATVVAMYPKSNERRVP